MLATYQAKVTKNYIEWIDLPPNLDKAEVTITVFPKGTLPTTSAKENQPKRQMPAILKGRGKEFDDIFDMSESYAEWNPMP